MFVCPVLRGIRPPQIPGSTPPRSPPTIGGSQKGGFQKGGFGGCSPGTKTGTRVRSPKPPFWKPPFYLPVTLFGVDKRVVSKKGGFGGCSPGTKTGTRVHSPKPPFYETALLSPSETKESQFKNPSKKNFLATTFWEPF